MRLSFASASGFERKQLPGKPEALAKELLIEHSEPGSMKSPIAVLSTFVLLAIAKNGYADQFDRYSQTILMKAIEDKVLKEVNELSTEQLGEYVQVLSDANAALVVVMSNDRRLSKLLLQPARQRVGDDKTVPMVLVQKFVTFKEGTERTIRVSGTDRNLYPSTRFHLDLGQVVPEKLGGDLLITEHEKDPLMFIIKPIDKAKIYVLTKSVEGLEPKKSEKLVIGKEFESKYFNGKFKLQDDGRRSGELTLKLNENGDVEGAFYSDKDGQKYEVKGKIGNPRHAISFTIKYPQTEELFTGMMFTGNGKFIAGTSKLQDREAAFIAERIED
jgi:hypothetical protein